jgi:DNA polymerase-3 subunit gamma/tau
VSSRALYRKYRSKNLQELVGQKHIVQVLDSAVRNNKISHAYLFTGPRGVGKTSIARIFAHQINGIEYKEESTNLDIIEIDAASNSGVDDMRDLKDKIGSSPASLKYKVYIIDEVHMLSGASFAALLKTIEEPPSHAVFILATTDAHKVPSTIMSRVQKFYFKPIDLKEIKDHLEDICKKEKIKISKDALSLIAESSEGSMRDALSLLDQVASGTNDVSLESVEGSLGLSDQKSIEELSKNVLGGELESIPESLNKIIEDGADPRALGLQIYQSLKTKLNNYDDFSTLSELLTIGSISKPTLGIEIILLKLTSKFKSVDSTPKAPTPLEIPQPETITIASKEVSAPKKNKPSSKKALKETKQNPETTSEAKAEESESNRKLSLRSLSEDWSAILENISKKSPSLKAVLKPSTQKLIEKTYQLTLELAYPMHLKMIQDTKNKKLLTDAFKECGLSLPNLEFIVSEKKSSKVSKKESGEHNNDQSNTTDLSDIISLMGGGETVQI